jgi:hypothetical protein
MKHVTDLSPLYEVVAVDGQTFGPFKSDAKAAFFATVRWPDQWRDYDFGGEGWSVQMVAHATEPTA